MKLYWLLIYFCNNMVSHENFVNYKVMYPVELYNFHISTLIQTNMICLDMPCWWMDKIKGNLFTSNVIWKKHYFYTWSNTKINLYENCSAWWNLHLYISQSFYLKYQVVWQVFAKYHRVTIHHLQNTYHHLLEQSFF